MRLFGVSMVRNEADVIEAFVRHNLSFLDGLLVTDHDSIDGTPGILAKLVDEGLPLLIERRTDAAFQQSEVITALAREAFRSHGADFVFALDADEFLKVESRARLEATLAAMPHGLHGLVSWLTYLPKRFGPGDRSFGCDHLRWRVRRDRQGYKAVVARCLLAQVDAFISLGNHNVALSARATAAHALLPRDVAYAHCPVRSCAQLAGKAVVAYVASLGTQLGPRRDRLWSELYHQLRVGTALTEEQASEIACNYGLPRKKWQPIAATELVEDPVQLAVGQRYATEALTSSLADLLRFAEEAIRGGTEPSRAAGVQSSR